MSFARRLKQFFRAMWREEQPKVRTNTVCQVVDYDGSTNLVSIQPCISVARPNGTDLAAYQLPVIEDIPVFQFGSGTMMITVAPATDSYGLYVVSDRDLNNWLAIGGIVDPVSGVMHDISSGFFLPGVYPTVADGDNGLISPAINTDRIELRLRDGSAYAALISSTGQFNVNGNLTVDV